MRLAKRSLYPGAGDLAKMESSGQQEHPRIQRQALSMGEENRERRVHKDFNILPMPKKVPSLPQYLAKCGFK